MIVVDTNVIAYLYIKSDFSEQSEVLLSIDPEWVAPYLCVSELRNVLSIYLRKELITFGEALQILQKTELQLLTRRYTVSSTEVMQLVYASHCSAYDCEFVALARHLEVSLVTADKKILREFPETAVSLSKFIS